MGKSNVVETLMGAMVLLIAAFFVFIAYQSGNISTSTNGYQVVAKFREIGNLSVGSDVRVGGIKIGSVTAQALEPDSYMAVITLTLNNTIKLPKDSSATIVSDGLLGGKYINITPGADEAFLANSDVIAYTQDAVNLESLIGKYAFGSVDKEEKPSSGEKDPLDF